MIKPVLEEPPLTFLGEEFLTWLWFKCETEGGEFTLKHGEIVGVSLEDYLCLGDDDPERTEQTLRRGLPTRAAEATAALAGGKRLKKARVLIAEGSQEWSVVLDGGLRFGSARCLETGGVEEGSRSDPSADRVSAFLRLPEIVSGLFGIFLGERLTPDFRSRVVPRMARWIASR
jgi:recombination associated protein RdgC